MIADLETTSIPMPRALVYDRSIARAAVSLWALIWEQPKLSVRQASDRLGTTANHITTLRAQLLARGWIQVVDPGSVRHCAEYRALTAPVPPALKEAS